MSDGTSLLFDLPGFRVVSCEEDDIGVRRVVVMQVADEHACPRCGVLAGGRPYDLRESRIEDLPFGQRRLLVIWRKRRYRCAEPRCSQRVFTERSAQVPPRCRLTGRLRARLEQAASPSARAISDVAAEYGVSWWSVHRALVAAAIDCAGVPVPVVRVLGLDETRARSLRWYWADGDGWRLSNPWMTSFVDLDLGRPGWLLGLVPGRSGAAVATWLAAQPDAWRAGIEVVTLDPYLIGQPNQMPVIHDEGRNEIGAAWGVKELLRQLLAASTLHDARHRLFRFYDAVLAADMPETTRLAETISTWWPAIEAFLRLRITNARTEGSNRVIKQLKRVGCGYRNQANYERRIVLHVAAKSAA